MPKLRQLPVDLHTFRLPNILCRMFNTNGNDTQAVGPTNGHYIQ